MAERKTFCGGMKFCYWRLLLVLVVIYLWPLYEWVCHGNWGPLLFLSLFLMASVTHTGAPLLLGFWLDWYLNKGQVVIVQVKAVTRPSLLGERKLTVAWRERQWHEGEVEIVRTLKVAHLGAEHYHAGDWLRVWLRPGRMRSWRPVDLLMLDVRIAQWAVPECLMAAGVKSVALYRPRA